MKLPYSWIKDFVKTDLSPFEIARKLTFAGLEVEGLHYVGLPKPKNTMGTSVTGLEWERDKLVLAEISAVNPHPNAERLVLADLWDGEQQHVVLTGAPNLLHLRETGKLDKPMMVAYAKLGARIYDGHVEGWVETVLKRAKIRGVESYSMVCSEKELGISEEHDGVIIFDDTLPDNRPFPPAGTPLVDVIGDVVFDISLTPNMVRNASVVGVAREIAAICGAPFQEPTYSAEQNGPNIQGRARIEIRQPQVNPRFTATLIEGVEIAPSPEWLQRRLRLCGQRAINNIVDITNYVMLETGQPLHAFDYDILQQRAGGKAPTIITRFPAHGEGLTTLDGKARTLEPNTILVADTAGALSLGGIMGGAESEVHPQTRNVLLEVASWDYINIRRTVQNQQLQTSQAGYRFSRGVHPAMTVRANLRAAELMRQLGKGVIAQGMLDEYPTPTQTVVVEYPLSACKRLLGVEIAPSEIVRILTALGFAVQVQADSLHITVPDTRLDISSGVIGIADITEEIARIYGYDNLPNTQIADVMPPQRSNSAFEREEQLKDLLTRLGLQEVITYRLTSPAREERLGEPARYPYLQLAKPITSEMTAMRQSVLSSVLEIAASNSRNALSQSLFEIGSSYLLDNGEQNLPTEQSRLVLVLTGLREMPVWNGGETAPKDYFDLKGVVDALVADLHLTSVSVVAAQHGSFHPGKCAELRVNGQSAGFFGELHPNVNSAYGLPAEAVLAADFELSVLLNAMPSTYKSSGISRYPAIVEDIALIVDDALPAVQVSALIAQTGGEQLADVNLFDVYRNESQLGLGKKSLAYRLTYQRQDSTLTDVDAAKLRTKIVRRLEREVGAVLRDR
jgi:phenylalanyl-tRNA synthetase beta chain